MTFAEKMTDMGITTTDHQNGMLTLKHESDAMTVVAAVAAMVNGAVVGHKFLWVSGGNHGDGGAWATVKDLA